MSEFLILKKIFFKRTVLNVNSKSRYLNITVEYDTKQDIQNILTDNFQLEVFLNLK